MIFGLGEAAAGAAIKGIGKLFGRGKRKRARKKRKALEAAERAKQDALETEEARVRAVENEARILEARARIASAKNPMAAPSSIDSEGSYSTPPPAAVRRWMSEREEMAPSPTRAAPWGMVAMIAAVAFLALWRR